VEFPLQLRDRGGEFGIAHRRRARGRIEVRHRVAGGNLVAGGFGHEVQVDVCAPLAIAEQHNARGPVPPFERRRKPSEQVADAGPGPVIHRAGPVEMRLEDDGEVPRCERAPVDDHHRARRLGQPVRKLAGQRAARQQ
jgi:hypothetical protein